MIKRIFASKVRNFTTAALLVAFSTFLSALLGLLRDRLLAGTFGAGETLDIYFAAFRIPDLIQAILVAGGISATFLPIFSEELKKSKEKAFAFANNLLNSSLLLLIIVCLLFGFLAPWILRLVTPGFNAEQIRQVTILTRIMFFSPILFGLSAIFSGVLQYFDRFLVYSLAPIFYNIGIILGILFFLPIFGVYGLGLGVIIGALFHFLIQAFGARSAGYYYRPILNFKNYRLKKVLNLMSASSIGAFFVQLNLILAVALSSTLLPGAISIFTFANNLQGLPIGLIGIPFSVAVFPILSRTWAAKNKKDFAKNFFSALSQILFLVIPSSCLVFLLRAQIVRIVLGTGLWGWRETRLTAACLGIFSISILASSLVIFLRKSFYSIQEAKMPTFLEAVSFILNIGFSFLFLSFFQPSGWLRELVASFLKIQDMKDIAVIAFPLALSFSAVIQAILLFLAFVPRIGTKELAILFSSFKKILALTFLMGTGVWLTLRLMGTIFPLQTFWQIFLQAVIAFLVGVSIYVGGAFIFDLQEINFLKDALFSRKDI